MEDSATSVTSSIWASLNSWFTSTVFFVLLNLMIATIVFTSNLPNNNQQNNHQQEEEEEEEEQKQHSHYDRNQPQIARSPSILHRLKSFNFYPQKSQHESSPETHYHQHPLEVAATQYVFNQSLDYQHFDFNSTNPDPTLHQIREIQPPDTDAHVSTGLPAHYDFDHTRRETGSDTTFYFDPTTRQQTCRGTGFDFDKENGISTGLPAHYVFQHTSRETDSDKTFDFDTTTHQQTGGDMGFGFEPADEEHTDEFQSLDEVYSRLKTGGHDRTKSEGSIPPKPPVKMKKSASLKVGFSNLEEEEIVEARRPATVREKKSAVRVVDDDDVEVDSRADDFINKFKNDLKLQRIESIMRTKGATNIGTAK